MVRTRVFWIAVLLLMCGQLSSAQDLAGEWQGTIGTAPRPLRLTLHFEKDAGTGWKARLVSIDQSPDWGAGPSVDSVTVDGTSVNLAIAALRGTYDGTIAADGNSIIGTWSQGRPVPLTFARATPETAWKDPSPHGARFVSVESDVKLEVLDWGGPSTGARTLILVPGLGNTAHIFDVVAPKLAQRYRVVGVTRRGFGSSSAPATGYGADRLGDDVLAVMQALSIDKPVLAGHSLGGEELSSIGSRHPGKVAGLIYLDAGYSYAFHAPGLDPVPAPPTTPQPPTIAAIMAGMQQYTRIPVPILSIYALPHDPGPAVPPAARVELEAMDQKSEALVKAFESGLPTAKVVRIPRANHYVFLSHEADVLREVDAFIGALK